MQFVVKFIGIAAVAFVFASCHNDVPGLPALNEVQNYKYCKYGAVPCKSTYEISEKDCKAVGGNLFCDADCITPCEQIVQPKE